jgi:hypothetical protein
LTVWLLLGAALAVVVVVVVALPFLREPAPYSDALDELDPAGRELLEADHRGGRISDEDYRAVVGALRRDAGEALRAIDRLQEGTPVGGAKSG